MKIKSGDTSRELGFLAINDITGARITTALTNVVAQYSVDGGTWTAITTPTVSTPDEGDFTLAIDEAGMVTLPSGVETCEVRVRISADNMISKTRIFDLEAANPQVDIKKILGTSLSETASGRLAAALIKFLDVSTPVFTAASVNQTANNPTAADIKTAIEAAGSLLALIKAKADNIPSSPAVAGEAATAVSGLHNITAADVKTAIEASGSSLATIITNIAALHNISAADVKTAIEAAGSLLALIKAKADNIPSSPAVAGEAATAASGLHNISAADVKAAIEAGGSSIALIKAKTDNLPASPAIAGEAATAVATLHNISTSDVLDQAASALTSYGANKIAPATPANVSAVGNAVAALHNISAADVIDALKSATGFTQGGTWTFAKLMKVMTAICAGGSWRLKSGEINVYEILDPDSGGTVIAEATLAASGTILSMSIQI